MADNLVKQLILKIFADTGDAKKKAGELGDTLDNMGDKAKKGAKGVNDNTEALKKHEGQSKKSEKAGFGMIDMLKGLGIAGIASKAIDTMTTAFMSNQKVADAVNAVIGTINEVVSQLIDIFVSAYESVSKSTGGFDALGKVLRGVITLAIAPFKTAWYEISLGIDLVRLAWEKSPFGSGDTKTIEALTASITETKDKLVQNAKDMIDAGKDIVTNFVEAVGEVGKYVEVAADGISKIDVAATFSHQQNIQSLKNTSEIAAAQLQGLVEKYGTQAETLRQIRDDDRKSIDERIKANNELKDVLDKQEKSMLALADKKIQAAAEELSANKTSVELQKNLINAQNERAAVENQIAGFRSEQLANEKALAIEAIALAKTQAQNENELYLTKRKNAADLIKDELARAEQFKLIRAEERALELQRLQDNINQYAEGTQARIDAEAEFNTKKQEFDAADAKGEEEIANIKKNRAIEVRNAKVENALAEFDLKKQLLENENKNALEKAQEAIQIAKDELEQKRIANENAMNDELAAAAGNTDKQIEIKEKYRIKNEQINAAVAKSEKELSKAKQNAYLQAADAISASLKNLADLFGKQSKAGKAAAIAAATIDTLVSAWKVYKATADIPYIGPVLAPINAAIALAAGYKNVQEIKKVQVPGGGADAATPSISMSGAAPLTAQATQTILPQEQINQLSAANAATRAYVVESDVTNNQERIVRLNRAARIN